jgi:hypothetical protein
MRSIGTRSGEDFFVPVAKSKAKSRLQGAASDGDAGQLCTCLIERRTGTGSRLRGDDGMTC